MLVADVTDTPVWFLFGATAALALGAWIALLSVWDGRKTREAQLLLELSERWSSKPLWESSALFREYGSSGAVKLVDAVWGRKPDRDDEQDVADWLKDYGDWETVSLYPDLIEDIGALVSRRLLPARLVYEMWGGNIMEAWSEWHDAVQRLRDVSRKDERFPGEADMLWLNFENVARRMRRHLKADVLGVPPDWRRVFYGYRP